MFNNIPKFFTLCSYYNIFPVKIQPKGYDAFLIKYSYVAVEYSIRQNHQENGLRLRNNSASQKLSEAKSASGGAKPQFVIDYLASLMALNIASRFSTGTLLWTLWILVNTKPLFSLKISIRSLTSL